MYLVCLTLPSHWRGNPQRLMVDLLFLNILLSEEKSTRKPGRRYAATVCWPNVTKFKVLTAALLKIQVLWDVMLCCWVGGFWRFKGLQCFQVLGLHVILMLKVRWFFELAGTTDPVTEHHSITTLMFCVPLCRLQVKMVIHHIYVFQKRAPCLFKFTLWFILVHTVSVNVMMHPHKSLCRV